jgi:hypothetical protein
VQSLPQQTGQDLSEFGQIDALNEEQTHFPKYSRAIAEFTTHSEQGQEKFKMVDFSSLFCASLSVAARRRQFLGRLIPPYRPSQFISVSLGGHRLSGIHCSSLAE